MAAPAHAPSSLKVSERMRRTRRRDTKPELAVRSLLHARGYRYRVDRAPLPDQRRRSDIVFPREKVAVFIDGCFWHGCPEHATWPKHNAAFWREKIETNKRRDRDTDERLERAGWLPLRAWEHEDPGHTAARIAASVEARRSSS